MRGQSRGTGTTIGRLELLQATAGCGSLHVATAMLGATAPAGDPHERVEELVAHIDRLRRDGLPIGPDAYLFPNVRGGRISRQRVGEIVRDAATRASERLVDRGLPPLPNTTPHSLRRTYISIALLANRFDVMWVMSQVGHADSKMTTDVYNQLRQRVRRDHGRAFDALVRQAREHLYGTEAPELATDEPAERPA